MNSAGNLQRISILGIGNVLLGDDGFGPLLVELFRCAYECSSNVEILDLGTPGLDIAPYLYDRDLVLLLDAVHAKEKAGALCIYCDADLFSRRAQLRLTAHDPGVQESLIQLKIAGHAPSELIIIGVVPESCGIGEGISAAVLRSSYIAVDNIARLLLERGVDCHRRAMRVSPNLWWLSDFQPQFVA